jgi:phosphoribosylanthranilate isomerase
MTLVKICGIREYEHAQVAAQAGADAIGFVFVPVRREVSPETARSIIERVRSDFERPPATVGLFVNESAEAINSVVRRAGLDLVQLHGDEPPELAAELDAPAIKALRVGQGDDVDELEATIAAYLQHFSGVHIDSHVPGHWGGTGVVGDWDVARRLAGKFSIVLAGGLSPDNVGTAIEQVRPAVVDVSSGVEIDGRKDPDLIRAFIASARTAYELIPENPAGAELVTFITELRSRHRSTFEDVSTRAHSRSG